MTRAAGIGCAKASQSRGLAANCKGKPEGNPFERRTSALRSAFNVQQIDPRAGSVGDREPCRRAFGSKKVRLNFRLVRRICGCQAGPGGLSSPFCPIRTATRRFQNRFAFVTASLRVPRPPLQTAQSCPRRRAGVAHDERPAGAMGNSSQPIKTTANRPQIVRKNRISYPRASWCSLGLRRRQAQRHKHSPSGQTTRAPAWRIGAPASEVHYTKSGVVRRLPLMANERTFLIYLSSTVDDLKIERAIAERIAARHGQVRLTRRADSTPVVDACLRDVRGCDVYVGIIGMRYGWQPDRSINPESKSITELEYDACGDSIPRLVFVNDGPIRPKPPFQDDDTTQIRAFRSRVQDGLRHTAYPFDDQDDDEEKRFALKLDQALTAEKARFLLKWSTVGGTMGGAGRPRKDCLSAVVLIGVEGEDDAVIAMAKSVGDPNVACTTLRLDHLEWWTELDRHLRIAQSPCLLLTPAGLSRLGSHAESARIASVLRDGRSCARPVTLVLAGVDAADVPPAWRDGLLLAVDPVPSTPSSARTFLDTLIRAIDSRTPSIEPTGHVDLDLLHRQWHAQASQRSGLVKVGLPVVIVAPTVEEIQSLADPARSGFSGFEKALRRQQRVQDFKRLQPDRKRRDAGWPGDTYHADRAQWRCFGPACPPAMALVLAAVKAINDAAIGTRERRLLPRMRVVLRLYLFDDLRDQDAGRAAALLDATAAGALVIVDEFALLHPRLREAVRPLLDLPRAAAVSISASDPMHSTTADLLNEDSFLQVGLFLRRYGIERDPRCEVAVNSVQRLERWIRMVVPEMLALGDAGEALPGLASKVSEVLEPTTGLP